MQVLSSRGGPQPKIQTPHKTAHIGMTAFMPARGPIGRLIWTFAGDKKDTSRIANTRRSLRTLTHNGWPDATTWHLTVMEIIRYKEEQGLEKVLLLTDNAPTHFLWATIEVMIANNIRHVTLIPQSTGYTQPLDVCFFGPLASSVFAAENGVITEDNLAEKVEQAINKMETKAFKTAKKEKKPGQEYLGYAGFKKSGLYPPNRLAHADRVFAPSDARLNIDKDSAEVAEAMEATAWDLGYIKQDLWAGRPEVLAAVEERAAKELEKAQRFDPTRNLVTDAEYLLAKATAEKEKEEAAIASKERGLKRKANAAANKAAKEAKMIARMQRDAAKAAALLAADNAQSGAADNDMVAPADVPMAQEKRKRKRAAPNATSGPRKKARKTKTVASKVKKVPNATKVKLAKTALSA